MLPNCNIFKTTKQNYLENHKARMEPKKVTGKIAEGIMGMERKNMSHIFHACHKR